MRPALWLRTASILTLLHALLHTIGGVFGTPPPGPAQTAVTAMQTNTFLVMGHLRSYWSFYRGMGLGVTIFLCAEALAFWVLSNSLHDSRTDLRDLLVVFVIGYIALAANSLRYFFLPPVVVELLIAACLVMAILGVKRTASTA